MNVFYRNLCVQTVLLKQEYHPPVTWQRKQNYFRGWPWRELKYMYTYFHTWRKPELPHTGACLKRIQS